MHASDNASGREARRHALVSQTSGMLALSTNERDVDFGMRSVAGDTMYSAYAPCEENSLPAPSRRDEGRHAYRTRARRPRRPPSIARSPRVEPSPSRRRRPPPAAAQRARQSPRNPRRGSHSRPSALHVISASAHPTLHGKHAPRYMPLSRMMFIRFRPNTRILTSTWPGPGTGRGAARRRGRARRRRPYRRARARRASSGAEEDMIMGDCGVCGRCVRTGS
jgi:hypothetical protein